MIKVCLIGYGSVGRRHCKNLNDLGYEVNLLTRRHIQQKKKLNVFKNFKDAIKGCTHVVICNETNLHFNYILSAIKKNLHIYCEKPIVESPLKLLKIKKEINNYNSLFYVGFQLRSSKTVNFMTNIISNKKKDKLLNYRSYVGQDLKSWRPKRDYRDTHSYVKKKGGGVLLELIHEIDLLNIFIGNLSKSHIIKSKSKYLYSDVEDAASINFKSKKGVLGSVFMDMVSPISRRYIIFTFVNSIYKLDLIKQKIFKIDSKGKEIIYKKFDEDRDKIFKNHLINFLRMSQTNKNFRKLNHNEFDKNYTYLKLISEAKY